MNPRLAEKTPNRVKILQLGVGFLVSWMAVMFSGCASAMLDKDEMHHAYFSSKGFISVDFMKQADGSYLFFATADVERSDKDILDAWYRFVEEVGRGRSYEGGDPQLSEFDRKQGYSPLNPYAAGQPRRLKRASGSVRFLGEVTEK